MIEICHVPVGLNCSIPASNLLRPNPNKSSIVDCINKFKGNDPGFGGLTAHRIVNGTPEYITLKDLRAYGIKDDHKLPTPQESDEIAKLCNILHEGDIQKVSSGMFEDDINDRFFELLFCISCTNPKDLCIATAEAKKLDACKDSKTLKTLDGICEQMVVDVLAHPDCEYDGDKTSYGEVLKGISKNCTISRTHKTSGSPSKTTPLKLLLILALSVMGQLTLQQH